MNTSKISKISETTHIPMETIIQYLSVYKKYFNQAEKVSDADNTHLMSKLLHIIDSAKKSELPEQEVNIQLDIYLAQASNKNFTDLLESSDMQFIAKRILLALEQITLQNQYLIHQLDQKQESIKTWMANRDENEMIHKMRETLETRSFSR